MIAVMAAERSAAPADGDGGGGVGRDSIGGDDRTYMHRHGQPMAGGFCGGQRRECINPLRT